MARTRLLELLTASGLADKDLERERIKAQRDAGIANSWIGALTNVGKSAVDAGVAVGAASEKSAKTDAEALLASNAGVTGAEAPAPMAAPADRSKLAALDDVVEYQPPPKDFVTVRAPSATTDLSAAATYKPTPSPLEAAKEPLRTPVPRSPFSALIYSKTPGEEAASITAAGLKPSDNAFADLLSGNARKEVAANTQKALAAQIVANRAAAQGRADTVDTRTQATQWHNQDTGLKIAGLNQAERHFGTKLEADAAAQQAGFKNAQEMQKAGFGNAAALQKAGFGHDDTKTTGAQTFAHDEAIDRDKAAQTRAETMATGKAAAAETARTKRPLESTVTLALGAFDSTRKLAAELAQSPQAQLGGPGAEQGNRLAHGIGRDDPDTSAFIANLKSLQAEYKKAMTGTGSSEKEADDLIATMPGPNDRGPTFAAKMAAFDHRVDVKKQANINALEKSNFDVSGWRVPTPEDRPSKLERINQLRADGVTDPQAITDALDKDGYYGQ